MDKKTVLVTQVIMTFLMAASMSGVIGLIINGPTLQWLTNWPLQFIVAWPIAFVLSLILWPASMRIAGAILTPRGTTSAGGKR